MLYIRISREENKTLMSWGQLQLLMSPSSHALLAYPPKDDGARDGDANNEEQCPNRGEGRSMRTVRRGVISRRRDYGHEHIQSREKLSFPHFDR